MGCLLGGSMVEWWALFQEPLCHIQVCSTQCPCPCSKPLLTHTSAGNTQTLKGRSVSVSVGSLGPGFTQGFVWALRASLAHLGFDSNHDFTLPTVLLGLLLCPWMWGIFLWWDPTFYCQQQVVILEFLQEKMSTHPSTLPSWFRLVTHPAQHFSCTQHIG